MTLHPHQARVPPLQRGIPLRQWLATRPVISVEDRAAWLASLRVPSEEPKPAAPKKDEKVLDLFTV